MKTITIIISLLILVNVLLTPPLVNTAQKYLEEYPLSYRGLYLFLLNDGYTPAQATRAIELCNVDWNEQVVRAAEHYSNYIPCDRIYINY